MKHVIILTIVSGSLMFNACRKDNAPEDVSKASILLEVESKAGANSFALGDTLIDDFGTKYFFTKTRMFLSNFTFDGNNLENYVLLTDQSQTFELGEVDPEGAIGSMSFKVGIDSSANHGDPTIYEPEHALYYNTGLHWGWLQGYRFILIEGSYDSDGDGNFTDGFGMHIGTMPLLRDKYVNYVDLSFVDGDNTLRVAIDWPALLTGVDLSTENLTHTGSNYALAEKVANNAPLALSKN